MRFSKEINVLISGGTGFIGKNLIKRLLEEGCNIFTIINESRTHESRIQEIKYDGSYQSISKPLEGQKIDFVIHLATKFLSNHKSNQLADLVDSNLKLGTFLLELTKEKNISNFINTSTYAQHYLHDGYNPQNLYSATKQAFEDLMKYYEETTSTFFLTLELTDTYGPDDTRSKFINLLLNAIRKNEPFNMSCGEQEICYLFVDDAIEAYLKAMELILNKNLGPNNKYSVYSNEIFRLIELVDVVCKDLNSNIEINKCYYPYREREIMTYKPTYKKLPFWTAKTTLTQGIQNILNHENK